MEDVLDVYTRPHDPKRPQVCLDETSRQLLADVTPPRPLAPGVAAKEGYEYERQGVVNLFLVCQPKGSEGVSQGNFSLTEDRVS